MTRTATVVFDGSRPECRRGLFPEAVTEAWYAAGCPRYLDLRASGLGRLAVLRWRASCLLRGLGWVRA